MTNTKSSAKLHKFLLGIAIAYGISQAVKYSLLEISIPEQIMTNIKF